MHKGNLSLQDNDKNKARQSVSQLKGIAKAKLPIEKRSFLNNTELFLSAREKILNNFKRKRFPIKKLYKTPTPRPVLKTKKGQTKKS